MINSKFVIQYSAFSFLFVSSLFSQEMEEKFFDIEDLEERELVERLVSLKEDPLNLNKVSYSDLLQIPWFYPLLVSRILKTREQRGSFENLSQLREIQGMSEAIYELVIPYLEVKPIEIEKDVLKGKGPFIKGRFRGRSIETVPLEDKDQYLGDSKRVYTRLDLEPMENLSLGFLTEKDPGEESYTDLLNYSLEWKTRGRVKKVLLGHYELDFGEGLLFSSSSFTFKGSGIVKGQDKGLRPYHSSDENGSLYGGALQADAAFLNLSFFTSFDKLDGTLNENGTVKSLYEEGYHRTENEVAKKDRVTENLIGGRLSHQSKKLKIGITGATASYDPPFQPEEDPRDPFLFEGESYTLMGFDFEVPLRELDLFSEVGYSLERGWGSIMGILYKTNPLEATLLFRNYEKDFYSPHSSGFSNSEDENELGSFVQVGYRLSPETTIRSYLDLFRYPHRRYFEDLPTRGREFRGEIEHEFRKDLQVEGRVWQKGREEYTSEDGKIHWSERRGIRLTGSWEQSKKVEWSGRIEILDSRIPDLVVMENGILLFGDIQFQPFEKTSLDGRIILFHTDSYDSRIYEYERDLTGVINNTVLFGEGRRFYLVLNREISKYLRLSGKFSTTYKERSSEETYGVQMDWKW